jgi:hypothetical protein
MLGFGMGCILIAQLVGNPLTLYAEQRSEKLALLSQHRDDSCSAAFGSSHIHNGFDPRVFDRTLGLHGIPAHTLNLAIEGGSQTEQFAMAKWFLAGSHRARAGGDCLIMLELTAGANFQERHLVHPRAINVYDASTADLSLKFSDAGISWLRRIGRSGFAIAAMSMHYLNVGMLASRVLPHEINRDLLDRESDFDRRGLLIEPPSAADMAGVAELFRIRPAAPRIVQVTLMRGLSKLVSRLEQAPGGQGVEYFLLVAPKFTDLVSFNVYPECTLAGNLRIVIINVARPPEYPELYRPDLWHDVAHLNEAGAAVYSRLVAEQMAKRKTPRQVPVRCEGSLQRVALDSSALMDLTTAVADVG